MAADIGTKITLEGERQYREQMRQITQATKTMRAETAAMESAWNKSTTAQQKATQQASQLRSQIDQQKQSLATAEANLQRYTEAYGENDRRTLKWKQTVAEARAELNRLEAELEKVPNSIELMGQKMQNAGQKIQSVGRAMSTAGTALTKTVTAPIAAMGVAATKVTADFDESMSKVRALSGATGSDFDMLREKARDMGASTRYSAKEAADALSYMALAGWDTNQMMDGLDGVLNLAASSQMDLAEASDLVTDYLSAFGLSAADSSRMADELAYAQAHSNTTTSQLGEAFGNSAAKMHTYGQSMETTVAMLEAFANQGTKGSEAGTQLAAVMRDITNNMEDGAIQIGDVSIAVKDQNGDFRNAIDIMADVEKAVGGMGSAEKAAALQSVFTRNSFAAVSQILTEGVGNVKEYEKSLGSVEGTAKEMAEVMQDNLKGQLVKLKSAVQELGISFGDILVPHIRRAVQWIQDQVDKFNQLDRSTKEMIVKFAGLAAAIGPVLLVGGKLTTAIGSMVSGAGKAVEWIGKMSNGNIQLAGILGPVGLAMGALAVSAVAVSAGLQKVEQAARKSNSQLYDALDATNDATASMKDAGRELGNAFDDANDSIETTIATGKRATYLADQLAELADANGLTTEQQNKQKAIVAELNSLYPELGIEIDDTTGKLNKSTTEIQNFVKNAAKMAQVKAYQEAISSVTKELSEAYIAQARAEMEADRAAEALSGSQSGLTSTSLNLLQNGDKLGIMQRQNGFLALNAASGYTAEGMAIRDAQYAMGTYNAENDKLTKQTDEAQATIELFQGKIDELTEGMGLTAEQTTETGDAITEMAGETKEAGDTVEDATQELIDAYNQSAQSAKDSILSQTNIWDELEQQEETSISKMRENLEAHIESYRSWNGNIEKLTSSGRYRHDENFRAMVNSLINAGQSMAPELQAIVNAYESGDSELATLTADYGDFSNLSTVLGDNLAQAQIASQYGIEGLYTVLSGGAGTVAQGADALMQGGVTEFNKPTLPNAATGSAGRTVAALNSGLSNTSSTQKTIDKSINTIGKKTDPMWWHLGADSAGSYGGGLKSGRGSVDSGMATLQQAGNDGIAKLNALKSNASTSGQQIASGLSEGVRAQRAGVNSAFTSLRTAASQGITQIQNLRSNARTAGQNVGKGVSDGLAAASLSNGIGELKNKVRDGITQVQNLGATAKSAGTSVGSNIASGLRSSSGSVSSASSAVAQAARGGVSALDGEGWTWGRHLGDNLASGIRSAEGNVQYWANHMAQLVRNILGHSTPKEGPLVHDDIWGYHLGLNFAQGMRESLPMVKAASLAMADAVALPTSAMMDIDAVSGRNVMEDALTLDGLHSVIEDAVGGREIVVQIGNREFARLLREQGAIA